MQRFEIGRHIRINTPNITKIEGGEGEEDQWYYGEPIRGEGMYECFGGGTCEFGRVEIKFWRPTRRIYTQVSRPTSARARTATVASTAGRRSAATSSTPMSRLRRARTVVSVKKRTPASA